MAHRKAAVAASGPAWAAAAAAADRMGILQETAKILDDAAEKGGGSVLVSYSGGKDSLVVLDLCSRAFKRIECFLMYLVPGLEVTETMVAFAQKRWGVTVHQVPHWLAGTLLKEGYFCFNSYRDDDLPDWKLRDVYDYVMADTGIGVIATGAKKSDGAGRRRYLANTQYTDIIYPIKSWNKFDVLGYLKAQKIPIPASTGQSTSGIDLSPPSLKWLHRTYPNDFRRLCEVFPFAEAVIWRERWYGI
jgi:phosphoadenosine phosphosulfate reductase